VAARLKRLEGMVREMLDEGGGNLMEPSSDCNNTAVGREDGSGGDIDDTRRLTPSASEAQVVRGAGARGGTTTYVGATHFMAMLGDVCFVLRPCSLPVCVADQGMLSAAPVLLRRELFVAGVRATARELIHCVLQQIEDLKSYFDHEETNEENGDSPESFTDGESPAMLIGSRAAPKTRQDLLDLLPPKHIADRLVMRYFNAHSASQRTQAALLTVLIISPAPPPKNNQDDTDSRV
jgi:hypothetical protein